MSQVIDDDQLLSQVIADTLEVADHRTPNEWARECRVLPKDSAMPGEFDPDLTPYVWAIDEAIASGKYRRVATVMGTQQGKTDLALNTMGQRLDDEPVPMMFIGATKKLVESMSRDRFAKLIAGAQSLAKKIADGGLDNLTEKWVDGVVLRFMWAGSAAELASHPACIVIIDERDRMPDDIQGEGDPVKLAEARTATYADSLVLVMSTPTIEGASPIVTLWEGGTRLLWHWACEECGTFFAPRFDTLKWLPGMDKNTVMTTIGGCWVECPHCQHKHFSGCTEEMNARGHYLAMEDFDKPIQTGRRLPDGTLEIEGEVPESQVASFWVLGLCSPFPNRTIAHCASSFLEALDDGPEAVKTVINTVFGQCYKEKGESISVNELAELQLEYPPGLVPQDAICLTAGVDVQKRSIYTVVRAWGKGDESWLVSADEIYGDTYLADVWQLLESMIDRRWQAVDGSREYIISKMCVDSGYRTGTVYDLASDHKEVVMACDGAMQMTGAPVGSRDIEVMPDGRKIPGGIKLWRYDKHYVRSWIWGRQRRAAKGDQPGGWYLPGQITEQYGTQITNEQKITKPSGRVVWVKKTKHAANHFYDAEVLARVGAHVINVDFQIEQARQRRAKVNRARRKNKRR